MTLDLNGYRIDRNAGENGNSGILMNSGSLTIRDSSEAQTGVLTGGCSNSPNMAGGITNLKGAELTLEGGDITNNRIIGERAPGKFGGGVYNVDGATFYMKGGKITNNLSCSNGGGIRNEGVLVLTGGEISGNTASDQIKGGGVASKGTLKLSGNPKIHDNRLIMEVHEDGTVDTDPSNLYIYPMTPRVRLIGPLTNEMKIGIDMGHPRSIQYLVYDFEKYMGEDADPNDYFKADSDLRGLDKTPDGDVRLFCYADSYTILYEAVIGAQAGEEARIDLTDDCKLLDWSQFSLKFPDKPGEMTIGEGRDIILNLNGFTIDRNAAETQLGGVISNSGKLTIMDTSEGKTGKIIGGCSDTAGASGGITNHSGAELIMKDVTICDNQITGEAGADKHGAAILNEAGGTVTLSNAKVLRNTSSSAGGGIWNSGSLTVDGGEISGNTSGAGCPGGGIASDGVLYLTGAPDISGNLTGSGDTGADSNVYLYDTETSRKIVLKDISAFPKPIGVAMDKDAQFTEGFAEAAGAADPTAYFVSEKKDSVLTKGENGELCFKAEPAPTEPSETQPAEKTYFADPESMCNMVVIDFEKKKGIAPAKTEITEQTDSAIVIRLSDADGNVLDVYTLDRVTGLGTNQQGEAISLPETGVTSAGNAAAAAGAAVVAAAGFLLIFQSGILRRRKNSSF